MFEPPRAIEPWPEPHVRLDFSWPIRVTTPEENRQVRRAMRRAQRWMRTSTVALSMRVMRLQWIDGQRRLAAKASNVVSMKSARARLAS